METNKLSVNAKKSEVIAYGRKTTLVSSMITLKLNNSVLKFVEDVKFLGVYFDNLLTFNKNANRLRRIINDKNYIFSKNRFLMDELTCTNTLKVMINPYLDYANLVFLGISEFLLNSIQTSFNNSMRIASKTKWSDKKTVASLLQTYDLLTFKGKIILSILRIFRRKIARARSIFEDGKLYEYNEYNDSGLKIIKIISHILEKTNGKKDIMNFKLKTDYDPLEHRLEDQNYSFSQGKIKIIRLWESPLKITRNSIGYTVHSFISKKSRVINSCAVVGPKLWNCLPSDIRNDFLDKNDFTAKVTTLVKEGSFDDILKV